MNCKKGDLAVIVRSMAGNEGRIVQCLRIATDAELSEANIYTGLPHPFWVTDKQLPCAFSFGGHSSGVSHAFIPDAWLRPIRDSDGTDEMLRIAGLPKRDEVKA